MSNRTKYQPGIVEVLGSGTSTGVPTMGCSCPRCRSNDPRDRRTRVSITITAGDTRVLVDTTPDLRLQYLRSGQPDIDAVIYTHHHFDHIGGFDDLRGLNFKSRAPVPIYGMRETLEEIERFFSYAFTSRGSLSSAPKVVLNEINLETPFRIMGIEYTPLLLEHGSMDVMGIRTGSFAYCTDCSAIPAAARNSLGGVTDLIIDGLRSREHPMHMTFEEATRTASEIGAERTWLTHIAHETSHAIGLGLTPENVKMAYDGLKIPVMTKRGK